MTLVRQVFFLKWHYQENESHSHVVIKQISSKPPVLQSEEVLTLKQIHLTTESNVIVECPV